MVQAVIFDIDGVLLDSFEANLKFYQDMMVRFGYPSPTRAAYTPLFHLSFRDVIEQLMRPCADEEIEKVWKVGKERDFRYPSELLAMPDGVEEVVSALYQKYKLAIATSRLRNGVYESPHLAGLQKYFQVVAAYEDTERHKPHADPLLFAAKELGVEPKECVYIGDVMNDVIAAHAAGMKAVIYAKSSFAGADACTADFHAVPTIIDALCN